MTGATLLARLGDLYGLIKIRHSGYEVTTILPELKITTPKETLQNFLSIYCCEDGGGYLPENIRKVNVFQFKVNSFPHFRRFNLNEENYYKKEPYNASFTPAETFFNSVLWEAEYRMRKINEDFWAGYTCSYGDWDVFIDCDKKTFKFLNRTDEEVKRQQDNHKLIIMRMGTIQNLYSTHIWNLNNNNFNDTCKKCNITYMDFILNSLACDQQIIKDII